MTESEYTERSKELRAHSPIGAEALRYAYIGGFYILPLIEYGKLPLVSLVPNGFKDASNDPGQILDWWTQEPDANIGFVPGLSGLIGIDVDGPSGRESLKKLEAELGVLPMTCQVRSGREEQGDHLYFRVPDGLDIKNVNGWHEGIDLKYKGGYLILPPSIHPSGKPYQFVYAPFTQGPQAAMLPKSWIRALPLHSSPVAGRSSLSRPQGGGIMLKRPSFEQARKLVDEAQCKTGRKCIPVWHSFADVKARARGKWGCLLDYLCPGFTEPDPSGNKYGTCPVCGKKGKFKLFDDFNETGTCICYSCHPNSGDGIATLAWLLGCTQDESMTLLCDLLQTNLMK